MLKEVTGELVWIKTHKDYPEEYEGKKSWSVTVYPNSQGLEDVRMWQAEGLKNKLKKDDKGWYVKFSRPTEKINKKSGKVVQVFEPPVVTDSSGTVVDSLVANGATGTVRLDYYSHKAGNQGTAHAARLDGIKLDKYELWQSRG